MPGTISSTSVELVPQSKAARDGMPELCYTKCGEATEAVQSQVCERQSNARQLEVRSAHVTSLSLTRSVMAM
jgi:hypothetical protein